MWEISQNRRVIFGAGTAGRVGELASRLNVRRAFVITYNDQAEKIRSILASITGQGIERTLDRIRLNQKRQRASLIMCLHQKALPIASQYVR